MITVPRPLSHFCPVAGTAFALAVLLTGCGKNEVQSYRVPKENAASLPGTMTTTAPAAPAATGAVMEPVVAPPAKPGAPAAPMADTPVVTASGPGLTWTAPAGWTAKPLGAMRKGSFTVPGEGGASADLSITAFPGAVGGDLANVNRWRGQVGLAPIAEGELAGSITTIQAIGLTVSLVDLPSADPAQTRILGAMVPYQGAMWFFKLTGPGALVGAVKPAFIDFLKTVKATAP